MRRPAVAAPLAFTISLALCSALGTTAHARPTDPTSGDLRHYAPTDTVEHYDTTRFRIFFIRALSAVMMRQSWLP